MRSPINASPPPSQMLPHDSGASVVRYTFTAIDFHSLLFAGFAGALITSCITEASEKRRRGGKGQFQPFPPKSGTRHRLGYAITIRASCVPWQSRRPCRLYSRIATQSFVANAQKFSSFTTTRGLTKPAALSFSVKPLFGCPE